MNKTRGWITTTFLAMILTISAGTVEAGIIVGNRSTDVVKPCTGTSEKLDWGIIVGNITGIIVGNLTGIIVGNANDTATVDCGIIVGN